MFSVREVPVREDVHAYHVLSVDQYLLVMEMVIHSSTSTPPGGGEEGGGHTVTCESFRIACPVEETIRYHTSLPDHPPPF